MNYGLFLQITTGVEGVEDIPQEETLSIMSLLIGGGWYIMIPLGILSIVAVYIFV